MRKTLSVVTMLAILLVQFVVPAFGWTDFAKNLYSKVSEEQSKGLLGSLLPSTLAGTPAPPPACSPGTFTFSGNSAKNGTDGIIRTFTTAGGVNVHASAWSIKKNNGNIQTAYLGV